MIIINLFQMSQKSVFVLKEHGVEKFPPVVTGLWIIIFFKESTLIYYSILYLVLDGCLSPGHILYGNYTPVKTHYSYGDVVTYWCMKSPPLTGSQYRACLKDNSWSGETPSCFEGKIFLNACYWLCKLWTDVHRLKSKLSCWVQIN